MTAINYKLLNAQRFARVYNWSVRYSESDGNIFSEKFGKTKINSVLRRNKTIVNIQNGTLYKRVTVKLYGGGVKIRDEVLGNEIKTKKQFLLKKGQFLYSRIDARNGAFGLATQEVNNAIVTNDFPVFDIDTEKIAPEYLSLITSSKAFSDFCQSLSSGTTGRQRMSEDSFLDFEIPLPDLTTQNHLVNQYNQKLTQAQEAENQADELEKGIEYYLLQELGIENPKAVEKKRGLQFVSFKELSRWGVEFLQINDKTPLYSTKYPTVNFEDYAFINPKINFNELKKNDEITFIPMEVISDEYGQLKEYRITKVEESKGYTKIEEGDLIWAKITPCMENGKSAIVKNLKNGFACGSTEFHVFRAKNKLISLDFIYSLFRSEFLKSIAKSHFTGSAGQQRVPAKFFKDLKIPLPPREYKNNGEIDTDNDIQTQIVNHITSQKEQIKTLRTQAEVLKKQAKADFENEIFN